MNFKNKKGVTLIELIIAMALSIMLIIPVMIIFITANTTLFSSGKLSTAQTIANLASDKIKRELSFASNAVITNTITLQSDKYYIFVQGGMLYKKSGSTNTDEEIINQSMLNTEGLAIQINFNSPGGKIINAEISILEISTNNIIYKLNKSIFFQNMPDGVTIANSTGSIAEYSKPS